MLFPSLMLNIPKENRSILISSALPPFFRFTHASFPSNSLLWAGLCSFLPHYSKPPDSPQLSDGGGDVSIPGVQMRWMQTCNLKRLKWSNITRTFTVHLPSNDGWWGGLNYALLLISTFQRFGIFLKYLDKRHNNTKITNHGSWLFLFCS